MFDFKKFKEHVSIEDVAKDLGIPLKGECPACAQKTGFSINNEMFNCFQPACGVGGDVFHLWAAKHGGWVGGNWDEGLKKRSFEWVIDQYGTESEKTEWYLGKEKETPEPTAHEKIIDWYTEIAAEGHNWLRDPVKIKNEALPIERMRKYLRGRGYTDPQIDQSDWMVLGNKKYYQKSPYADTLRGFWSHEITLALPHRQRDGKVIGFKRRDYTDSKDPRFDSFYIVENPKNYPDGLHRVTGDTVYLCEGTADVGMLGPMGYPIASIGGGTLLKDQVFNLKQQNIKTVLFCMDNDEGGRTGLWRAVVLLHELYPTCQALAVPYDLYRGKKDPDEVLCAFGQKYMDDFFNSEDAVSVALKNLTEGKDKCSKDLAEFIVGMKYVKSELRPIAKMLGCTLDVLERDIRVNKPEKKKKVERQVVSPPAAGNELICLGSKGDSNFFYSTEHKQLYVRTPDKLKEAWCTQMVSDRNYWMSLGVKFNATGISSPDWAKISAHLQQECGKAGYYALESAYDIGVYREGEDIIVNLGTGLRVWHADLKEWKDYDYEQSLKDKMLKRYVPASGHTLRIGEEATIEEVGELRRIIKLLPFTNDNNNKDRIDALVFEGILYTGCIGGALDRRMHGSLTGPKSVGKSKILELLVAPVWSCGSSGSPKGMINAGRTTEAGLRQANGKTDRPIIIDETENLNKFDASRIEAIVEATRNSYTGSIVTKGTIGQRSVSFQQRSVYMLSSIDHPLKHPQDFDRFHIFNFSKEAPGYKLWGSETHPALRKLIDKEFGSRIFSRLLSRLPRILEIETLVQDEIMLYTDVERAADNYGAILACLMGMHQELDVPINLASIKVLVKYFMEAYKKNDNSENLLDKTTHSELKLSQICRLLIKIDGFEKSMWEFIYDASLGGSGYVGDLKRFGVFVDKGYVWIANKHDQLDKLLVDRGSGDRSKALAKLPGALKDSKWFAGSTSRCVGLPFSVFNFPTNFSSKKVEEEFDVSVLG